VECGERTPRVDIHTHVLPGLDDGARDLAEAIAMLRVAAEDGTSILVATPHARRCSAAAASAGAELVRAALQREGLALTLLLGMEEQLLPDLPDRLLAGEALPLGDTRWLLVELPDWTIWPANLGEQLATIRTLGYRPILAHVERYTPVQRQPERVLEALAAGALLQVNADSLFGQNGPDAQRVAAQLVRAGAVSVLASDAHKPDWRAPRLRAAFDRVRDLAGSEIAERLLRTSHAIVQGEDVPPPEPDLARWQASPSLVDRLRSWVGV
jgi:protein-tyrosine phosphatase